MANVISLAAIPGQVLANPNGQGSDIRATVTDSLTGQPVSDVPVRFTTTTLFATLPASPFNTNAQGVATVRLSYPQAGHQLSGAAVIPVLATAPGASATILVNFYNFTLRALLILNAPTDPVTLLAVVPRSAIIAGLQVLVYLPADTQYGNIITFFWESQSVQMVYTGGALVWVININNSFIPEQALSPGDYSVWYLIEDFLGNVTGSSPVYASIRDTPYSAPALLAPILLPATLNGTINLVQAQAGVSLRLPLVQQPSVVHATDAYRAYMVVFNPPGQQQPALLLGTGRVQNPVANFDIAVPSVNLANLNGVFADFYYTITTNSQSTVLTLTSVSTRVYIDTVPPGGN